VRWVKLRKALRKRFTAMARMRRQRRSVAWRNGSKLRLIHAPSAAARGTICGDV
jgi:hypothetical protein